MDGLIIIDKPAGATSHQIVGFIRKLCPDTKAGHTGTLDPMASGVLPVCLGRATRVAEYLIDMPKTYRAEIMLGVTTDTEDAAGQIIDRKPVPALDRSQIEQMLEQFRGLIEQVPPLYSAVKYRGKPLYHWTRRGENVPRHPRKAEIYALDLLEHFSDIEPRLIIEVRCSKGTYIRTLAADLGKAAGCGAHLSALVRLAVGPYTLDHATQPDIVAKQLEKGQLKKLIKPIDSALKHLPELHMKESQINALRNGRAVEIAGQGITVPLSGERRFRVYGPDGNFKAIARLHEKEKICLLKTEKFLAP